MSGIFGNNLEDFYHELELDRYTDRIEDEIIFKCKLCGNFDNLGQAKNDRNGDWYCGECLDVESDYFTDLINTVRVELMSTKLKTELIDKYFNEHPELELVINKNDLI